MTIIWSPVEDTFLVANVDRLSYEELSLYLGKTENAIRERNIFLGFSSSGNQSKSILRVCAFGECQKVFSLQKKLILKDPMQFCSDYCKDEWNKLSFPDKETLEHMLFNGLSNEEISLTLNISAGVIDTLLLKYRLKNKIDNSKIVIGAGGLMNKKKNTKNSNHVPMTNRFKGGYKPYLNTSVRSGWENNVLLWLNHKKIKWEYEPKVFYFDEIKRGTRGYTPDIWLPKEKIWIEVKGYLSSVDKTKIKRFKKYYPEEFQKLQALTKNDKVESTKFFKSLDIPIYAYYDDIYEEYNHLKNWIV